MSSKALNVYQNKSWQFPKHASRSDIASWLDATYKGKTWEGWPGTVYGCGRPFCFPESPSLGTGNIGVFLTWNNATEGDLEDIRSADPTGDYSRVVHPNWEKV